MDNLNTAARSKAMAAVMSKNTAPELSVRRMLHALGYRFRLHCAALPGNPDITFASRKKVIFVHGCFWHRHHNCKRASTPQTREEYWTQKFARNIARDSAALRSLKGMGWQAIVVWECQLKQPTKIAKRLTQFLDG